MTSRSSATSRTASPSCTWGRSSRSPTGNHSTIRRCTRIRRRCSRRCRFPIRLSRPSESEWCWAARRRAPSIPRRGASFIPGARSPSTAAGWRYQISERSGRRIGRPACWLDWRWSRAQIRKPFVPHVSFGTKPSEGLMRRYRHILVIAIAAVTLAGPAAAPDKPRSGGELIFAVPSEPPSYDAHREETFGVIHPVAPHYNTLLRPDPTDRLATKIVGDLAESWTISKDGRTYTLKLRHGVKFHDGSEMTSKDAKASYDKIIFPPAGVASDRKGEYLDVEAVQAPDPYTIVFRLKWPSGSFLMSLASPWNWIYKADILAKDMRWYETHVMGTGPFVFVEHVRGSHWVGKKNPNYWDKGKPYLDGYRAVFIKDSAAQVAAVRGERAHIQFRGFSPAERDSLVQALGPKITVQESPWDCALLVAMNHERKPFDDKRVRRALTLALDRYQGAQALSKIAIVKEPAGVQVPGMPFATGPAEHEKQSRAIDAEERRRFIREFERRLLDEEVHYIYTLQWHRIIPHLAKVRGWTITPSHYLNQQLDAVWLAE